MQGDKLYTGRVRMFNRSNPDSSVLSTVAAAQGDADTRVASQPWVLSASNVVTTWEQARNLAATGAVTYPGSYMRRVGLSNYIAVRHQWYFQLLSALRCEIICTFASGGSLTINLDQGFSVSAPIDGPWTSNSFTGNNSMTVAVRFPPYAT